VRVKLACELIDPLTGGRDRGDDRGFPVAGVPVGEGDHVPQVADRLLRAVPVGLVHREHIADLQDACLGRLDRVAHPRRDEHQCRIGK